MDGWMGKEPTYKRLRHVPRKTSSSDNPSWKSYDMPFLKAFAARVNSNFEITTVCILYYLLECQQQTF